MLIRIYNDKPNIKDIARVAGILKDGGLMVYPTDSVYAIGCDALNVRAVERICKMKNINPQKSDLSIICRDLAEVSKYARMSNSVFKLMKKNLPGPYTQKQKGSGHKDSRQQHSPRTGRRTGQPHTHHVAAR